MIDLQGNAAVVRTVQFNQHFDGIRSGFFCLNGIRQHVRIAYRAVDRSDPADFLKSAKLCAFEKSEIAVRFLPARRIVVRLRRNLHFGSAKGRRTFFFERAQNGVFVWRERSDRAVSAAQVVAADVQIESVIGEKLLCRVRSQGFA